MKKYLVIILIINLSCNPTPDSSNEEVNNFIDSSAFQSDVLRSSFENVFKRKLQSYTIDLIESSEIEGEQGTKLNFSPHCFKRDVKMIEVQLIEVFSIQDMLINNLSTVTEDSLVLESGGMIYVNCLDSLGAPLELKEDQMLEVFIPSNKLIYDMKTFYGEETSNSVNWNLSHDNLSILNLKEEIQDKEFTTIGFLGDSIVDSEERIVSVEKYYEVPDNIEAKNIVGYSIQLSKLGWVNCDKYIEGLTTKISVSDNSQSKFDTYYLVLLEKNSVVINSSFKRDSLIHFNNVPLNETAVLIGFGSENEIVSYNYRIFNIGEEMNWTLKPKIATKGKVLNELTELFGENIWNRPTL